MLARFSKSVRPTRVQAFIALSLLPFGLVTALLFLGTGNAVPWLFVPINQPEYSVSFHDDGCRFGPIYDDSVETPVVILSCSRRFGARLERTEYIAFSKGLLELCPARVFEIATGRELGIFWLRDDSPAFEVSLVCNQLLSFESGARVHNRWTIWNLNSGKSEKIDLSRNDEWNTPFFDPKIAIGPNGRELLIQDRDGAVLYDLLARAILAKITGLVSRIEGSFFGSDKKPKLLIEHDKALRVWDLYTNKAEAILDHSKLSRYYPANETDWLQAGRHTSIGRFNAATWFYDLDLVSVNSLEDGSLLSMIRLPSANVQSVRIDPSGRFLACAYWHNEAWTTAIGSWSAWIDRQISLISMNGHRLAVYDLQTEKEWVGLPGGDPIAFSEGGGSVISFGEEGRFEYDLPPKWRYFTPWAWLALSAWVGIFICWFKLRKRSAAVASAI